MVVIRKTERIIVASTVAGLDAYRRHGQRARVGPVALRYISGPFFGAGALGKFMPEDAFGGTVRQSYDASSAFDAAPNVDWTNPGTVAPTIVGDETTIDTTALASDTSSLYGTFGGTVGAKLYGYVRCRVDSGQNTHPYWYISNGAQRCLVQLCSASNQAGLARLSAPVSGRTSEVDTGAGSAFVELLAELDPSGLLLIRDYQTMVPILGVHYDDCTADGTQYTRIGDLSTAETIDMTLKGYPALAVVEVP